MVGWAGLGERDVFRSATPDCINYKVLFTVTALSDSNFVMGVVFMETLVVL